MRRNRQRQHSPDGTVNNQVPLLRDGLRRPPVTVVCDPEIRWGRGTAKGSGQFRICGRVALAVSDTALSGKPLQDRLYADRPFGVAHRTEVFENAKVKGSEFMRKESRGATKQTHVPLGPERGSGSHGTLYVGAKFTVVKDLKKELGPGLLSDMLTQIGIRKEDL